MLQVSVDLREEVDELHSFLQKVKPEDWIRETGFMQWTTWDVVAHLHYFDLMSTLALEGEEAFAPARGEFIAAITKGRSNQEIARERFAALDAEGLLGKWRNSAHALAQALGQSDPKRRLAWFGPDMGVQMFTTARYMEVWAHGQEIYDLVGASRTDTDRIKNIATIGIKIASATICSIAAPNKAITSEAKIAVVRLIASQENRDRTVAITVSESPVSASTPPKASMSSWVSSRTISTTSSTVIMPTKRPASSTTGAEMRLYCSNQ